MASLEDFENILNAVGQGDRKAFHALFDLTAAKLFGICKSILDDDNWADEVLEQAYIEIWQNSINWQDSGLTPLTWVLSMTREYAIASRRAASPDGTPDPVELLTVAPSKDVESTGSGPVPALRKSLGWLPKDRRDAFLLSYFSGIRYAELATRFRVPYATVRNWQQRSLARLFADLSGKRATQDHLLAGEYVLDVIPVPEHEEFEARLVVEPDLQALVAGWTEDFIVLTDSVPERLPKTDMLGRLDSLIFPEQRKSLFGRVRLFQTVFWVAIAGGLTWAAYAYWPGLDIDDLLGRSSAPQQSIAQISQPDVVEVLPETGAILVVFNRNADQLQIGGDVSSLSVTPNLQVYLDFGDNTEWISLGAWPELPPRILEIPVELSSIVLGAELVILGGEGSDQEVLRLSVK